MMKLEILQENLLKGLSMVGRVITSKPQMPVLANILLETDNGRLKLSATDLEISITTLIGVKILKEGKYTIPAKTFAELVGSLPPGKVEMELEEGQLAITAGRFKAKVNGVPAQEWPLKAMEGKKTAGWKLEIAAEEFIVGVACTSFAAAADEGRPVLTGILFKLTDSGLTMVATDGFRLSVKKLAAVKAEGKGEETRSFIIPVKALQEVARILSENKELKILKINLTENSADFDLGDTQLSARLIEGLYPAYEKIIPGAPVIKARVGREELASGIRTAGVFARDSANIVKFVLNKSQFLVKAVAAQVGENESEIDAKIEGIEEELAIAFNFHYLLDLLNCAGKSEELTLGFSGPLAAGMFKISDDQSFLHIIMPVRVQS